jgi:hypothetical protein
LINWLPTPLLKNISHFEKLFSWSPNYNFLKKFGCVCFPNLRPFNSHKCSFRSKQCFFLGYRSYHKGYKGYHHESGHMYISRDVVFHESVFPFFQNPSKSVPSTPNPPTYSSFSLPINSTSVSGSTPPNLSPLPTNSSISHSPTSSSSTHVEPYVPPVQFLDLAPPRLQPMRTRSQNNVRQLQQLTDGTVKYPLPQALLSESALIEPTCFSNAVNIRE